MDDQDRHLAQRVEVMSAIVSAIDRRAEVVDAIGSSATKDDALAAVQELLGVSRIGAQAVLELQLRRFTGETRARIATELAEVRAQLLA